jgi:hypothetical protein
LWRRIQASASQLSEQQLQQQLICCSLITLYAQRGSFISLLLFVLWGQNKSDSIPVKSKNANLWNRNHDGNLELELRSLPYHTILFRLLLYIRTIYYSNSIEHPIIIIITLMQFWTLSYDSIYILSSSCMSISTSFSTKRQLPASWQPTTSLTLHIPRLSSLGNLSASPVSIQSALYSTTTSCIVLVLDGRGDERSGSSE